MRIFQAFLFRINRAEATELRHTHLADLHFHRRLLVGRRVLVYQVTTAATSWSFACRTKQPLKRQSEKGKERESAIFLRPGDGELKLPRNFYLLF